MKEYIQFDKMITPTIIKFIFWAGVGLSVLFGLITIISGATSNFGGGAQVLIGLVTIVLGPLVVRIYCELLIVLFKMHESLNKIANNSEK